MCKPTYFLIFVMFFDAYFFYGWEEQLQDDDESHLDHDYSELVRH